MFSWLLLGCNSYELTISPKRVPDTYSNTINLEFSGASSGFSGTGATLQIGGHDLLLRPVHDKLSVEIPKLAVGSYPISIDGELSAAVLEVYSAEMIVEFIDVGQGDAILIITPKGMSVLIDAGPPESGDAVLRRLEAHHIDQLDLLILSHTDADHLGGIPEIMVGLDGVAGSGDDISFKQVLHDGWLDFRTTAIARRVNALLKDGAITSTFADPRGLDVSLQILASGGATVDQVASNEALSHANARSIVGLLCLESFCGLLGGDITGGGMGTPDIETAISQRLQPLAWVKVPHHGSRSSSNRSLVNATKPRLAVFSLGDDNPFCHPTPEVVERWAETALLLSTGAGQSGRGSCAASEWPANSGQSCGTIVLRKGAAPQASVSCGDQVFSF